MKPLRRDRLEQEADWEEEERGQKRSGWGLGARNEIRVLRSEPIRSPGGIGTDMLGEGGCPMVIKARYYHL